MKYTYKDYTQMKHDFITNGLFNPVSDFNNVHTYVNDTYQAFLSVRPPSDGFVKHCDWIHDQMCDFVRQLVCHDKMSNADYRRWRQVFRNIRNYQH